MHALVIVLSALVLSQGHASPALAGISIARPRLFTSLQEAYASGPGEQVLMILHLPKESGQAFIEVYNRTRQPISLFQFTLTALGHEGELQFDDLPAGWSAVKQVQLSSLRELAIRNPKAFNTNADEITPRLGIHLVKMDGKAPKLGKRKI